MLCARNVAIALVVQTYVNKVEDGMKAPLALFLVDATSATSTLTDLTFEDLCCAIEKIHEDADGIVRNVRNRLEAMDTPDAIFDFFLQLDALMNLPKDDDMERNNSDTVQYPGGPIGLFLRRLLVAFHKSLFDALSKLFVEIKEYIHPSKGKSSLATGAELDGILYQEAMQIEYSSTTSKPSATVKSLRKKPKHQQQQCVTTVEPPRASYLRYLRCMEEGDFEGAVDSLHRYFDCGMTGSALDSQSPVSCNVQWAILSLAALHFRFGYVSESLQAIHETVKIAQQVNDHVCLVHALSWLYRLVGLSGDLALEARLIRRCIARAQELDCPQLQGSSMLSLAKHDLLFVRRLTSALGGPSSDAGALGTSPRGFWEDAMSASLVEHEHMLPGVSGNLQLLKSSAWELFGHAPLADAFGRMPLPPTDQVESTLRGPARERVTTEQSCMAFCKIAVMTCMLKDPKRGLTELLQARESFPSFMRRHWARAAFHLLFDAALMRGELARAEAAARQFLALCPAEDDAGAHVQARLCRVQLLLATADYVEAAEESNQLLIFCETRALTFEAVVVLTSLARIHAASGSAASALPIALSCLSLCDQHNLDSLKASASLILARLHLQLGAPHKALSLIEGILPLLLVHGTLLDRAEAHLLTAKSYFATLDQKASSLPPSMQSALEAAHRGFSRINHYEKQRETFYLAAMAYNIVGAVEQREACSASFVKASASLDAARARPVGNLYAITHAPEASLAAEAMAG